MNTTLTVQNSNELEACKQKEGIDKDLLLRQGYAVLWGVHKQTGSVVWRPVCVLQRSLRLGYADAQALLQKLCDQGVVRRQGTFGVRVFYKYGPGISG